MEKSIVKIVDRTEDLRKKNLETSPLLGVQLKEGGRYVAIADVTKMSHSSHQYQVSKYETLLLLLTRLSLCRDRVIEC